MESESVTQQASVENSDADYTWLNSAKDLKKLQQRVSVMQKLVHLDMKGAAPKLTYLEYFIPFVKSLGATGLLIGKTVRLGPLEHHLHCSYVVCKL